MEGVGLEMSSGVGLSASGVSFEISGVAVSSWSGVKVTSPLHPPHPDNATVQTTPANQLKHQLAIFIVSLHNLKAIEQNQTKKKPKTISLYPKT